jgi:hypothetical protein
MKVVVGLAFCRRYKSNRNLMRSRGHFDTDCGECIGFACNLCSPICGSDALNWCKKPILREVCTHTHTRTHTAGSPWQRQGQREDPPEDHGASGPQPRWEGVLLPYVCLFEWGWLWMSESWLPKGYATWTKSGYSHTSTGINFRWGLLQFILMQAHL